MGRRRSQVSGGRQASPAASPTSPTTAAFVELEAGVEGLVHVSEMSWTKKNVHPGKIVSTSQEVDVIVLDVDAAKRRVSPWPQAGIGRTLGVASPSAHPVGSTVEGEVKNATEFGLFIGLDNDIDGMVHLSDIDWSLSGEEALSLPSPGRDGQGQGAGRRRREGTHLASASSSSAGDPMSNDTYRKGQTVTATVVEVTSGGLEVKFGEDDAPMTAFIRKSDLSRDRAEQNPTLRRRRPPRRHDHQRGQGRAPRLAVGQGAGDGRRQGRGRAVRFVGLGRFAGRHPGRRPAREGQEGIALTAKLGL